MMVNLLVQPTGQNTAYTVFTQEQVDALRGEPGRGRVNVILRFDEHEFRTSIAVYRAEWMFVVNAAMRAAGLLPGASYAVELVRDLEPKRIDAAPDILAAIAESPNSQAAWDRLAPGYKRQHLRHIEAAKRAETRTRRIQKLFETLNASPES